MKIHLSLPTAPVGQQRPRFSKRSSCVYDPQSRLKTVLKVVAKSQMLQNGLRMLPDGPIQAEVYAYSAPPSSWSQKRLKCVSCDSTYKTTKPDLDNIIKLVLDILNGIAYSDDKLISRLISEKKYSNNPRIDIILTPLGEHG